MDCGVASWRASPFRRNVRRACCWCYRLAGFRGCGPGSQGPPARDGRGGTPIGLDDKAKNKAQELKGQAKEAAGRATDDEQLQAEGQADQAKGDLKQAGEKVKDAFRR